VLLHGNFITGDIPKEFGNLTSLVWLDLRNNRLIGEITFSLGNLKKLKFFFGGNNLNCGVNYSQPCEPNNAEQGSSDKPTVLIIGVSIAFVTVFVIGSLLLYWWKGNKREVKHGNGAGRRPILPSPNLIP
ncbi:putative LRR receptor-like protein kinase, partial [Trifolium pratense]